MDTVNVHDAKTHLSRLLERVAAGEEILIARNGQPIARLVAVALPQRKPGRLKGKILVGEDFDAPLPTAIARAFGRRSK